jgi:hypothetical protein
MQGCARSGTSISSVQPCPEGGTILRRRTGPLFHSPGQVDLGRKFRTPWFGQHRVKEKLSPIGYSLDYEFTKEVARVHVNRMRKFSEEFAEPVSPQTGVFPFSRRMALRVIDSVIDDGRFKVISPGRPGLYRKQRTNYRQSSSKRFTFPRKIKYDLARWKGLMVAMAETNFMRTVGQYDNRALAAHYRDSDGRWPLMVGTAMGVGRSWSGQR